MTAKMPNFYPKVDENALKQLVKLVAGIEGYLDDPNCPYSDEVKQILKPKPQQASEAAVVVEEIDIENMQDEELLGEINALYSQLKASGANIGTKDDKTDSTGKNVYFRLMAGLQEKIVKMRTEMTNKMNISKWNEEVLNAIDDELDADGRNRFMERLKKVMEQ